MALTIFREKFWELSVELVSLNAQPDTDSVVYFHYGMALTGGEAAEVHRPVQILQLQLGFAFGWGAALSVHLCLMSWGLQHLQCSSGVPVGTAVLWLISGCVCGSPAVVWRWWTSSGWTRACSESCNASAMLRSADTRVCICCCPRSASPVTLLRSTVTTSVHLFLLLYVDLCFLLSRNQPQSYRSFSSYIGMIFFLSFSLIILTIIPRF